MVFFIQTQNIYYFKKPTNEYRRKRPVDIIQRVPKFISDIIIIISSFPHPFASRDTTFAYRMLFPIYTPLPEIFSGVKLSKREEAI